VITAVFPFSLVMSCIPRWICTEAGNCLLEDSQVGHIARALYGTARTTVSPARAVPRVPAVAPPPSAAARPLALPAWRR
jgi:hypothetical protein